MLDCLTEIKTFRFKRMSPSHVKGYNLFLKEKGETEYQFFEYLTNCQETNPVETLKENVLVQDGYIYMPSDAFLDDRYPPYVLLNNSLLEPKDYAYSAYLKCIRLAGHVLLKEDDQLDLIYHRDLMVHEVEIKHELGNVKLYDYKVEPVYHNTHLIGFHQEIR